MVFASMQKLVCLVLLLPAAYALPWSHAERAALPVESTKKSVPLSTGHGAPTPHSSKKESHTTHMPERTAATEYIVKLDNTAVATIIPDAERPRTTTHPHSSHSKHLWPTGLHRIDEKVKRAISETGRMTSKPESTHSAGPPHPESSVKVEYIEVVSGKPVKTVTDQRELPPPFGNRAQATEHESKPESSHMTAHPTLKARAEPSKVPLSEEASLIQSELSSLYSMLGFPIPHTSTKKTSTTSSKKIVATGSSTTKKTTSTSKPLATAAKPPSTAKPVSTNKAASTSTSKKEESTTKKEESTTKKEESTTKKEEPTSKALSTSTSKKEESTTKAASTTPPPTGVKVVTTTVVVSGTTHTETKSA